MLHVSPPADDTCHMPALFRYAAAAAVITAYAAHFAAACLLLFAILLLLLLLTLLIARYFAMLLAAIDIVHVYTLRHMLSTPLLLDTIF